jgi:tripartite-type tricarboxylate transporter receptor subunit TctC
LLYAEIYPNRPITIVVGFGEGGSTDRMVRSMSYTLQEELKTPIKIINIKGDGSLNASKYVLKQLDDGYTIYASTFLPYLVNSILKKDSNFTIKDFSIINFQWFDFDFIAVNKNSEFNSILELLQHIKNKKNKKLTVAVLQDSSAHLLLKILLKKMNLSLSDINIKFYDGGEKARNALKNSIVDFIIIGAQGSEHYRNFIKPLVVIKKARSKKWDAPTLNEELIKLNIQVPAVEGSIRGFAVSTKFKENHPNRYNLIIKSFKNILSKKKMQNHLKRMKIGSTWLGPIESEKILYETFNIFSDESGDD